MCHPNYNLLLCVARGDRSERADDIKYGIHTNGGIGHHQGLSGRASADESFGGLNINNSLQMHTATHTHTHTHARTHIHMRTCTHIHTHAHANNIYIICTAGYGRIEFGEFFAEIFCSQHQNATGSNLESTSTYVHQWLICMLHIMHPLLIQKINSQGTNEDFQNTEGRV